MKKKALPEKLIYEIWKNQAFKSDISTRDGEKIIVHDRGVEAIELGGPDFKNARVQIGSFTYVGDIEIDNFHSDWKNHGHSKNPKFNKVILHVILDDTDPRNFVITKDGRKVPSISVVDFIDESLSASLREQVAAHRLDTINKISCKQLTSLVTEEEKLEFLKKLGIERFKRKCERVAYRLKEILYIEEMKVAEPEHGYDIPLEYLEQKLTYRELNNKDVWMQLFYEGIFEALGYSRNKEIMGKVAKAVDIPFLRTLGTNETFIHNAESIFFHISGLLDDHPSGKQEETSGYIRSLHEGWNALKDSYDGRTFEKEDWAFYRMRPQNYPTVRLAGGIRLLNEMLNHNLIGNLHRKFREIHNLQMLKVNLRALFVTKGGGYWSRHYNFDTECKPPTKFFIGKNRADEIVLNVVLPILYIFYEMFGKLKYASKTLKLYSEVEMELDNSLVNEISSALNLSSHKFGPLIYQGMLELFRNKCSKDKCDECEIGEKVFHE
ncbi:MAG: DUF2851 family protein [Ignavibacteriaceae bacterium]|nr:MAG: DUF2851 family protein [Ignavibacteriaceae bacterium]